VDEDGQLYFGGDIYTVDDARPTAEAVAVRDGEVIAVGPKSECGAALGDSFQPIDLAGRALLPGFIDTHIHPLLMVYFEVNVDLHGITSMHALKEKLRASAASASPGAWVVGLQFDEQSLDAPRFPTRHDLDEVSPHIPVVVVKHDGHTVIGSTAAIEACGVSASTSDPEGGLIDRESDGYPAGPFREEASNILKDNIPIPDMQAFMQGAASSFARLAASGITSAGAVMQTGEEGPAGAQGAFEIPLMQVLLDQIPINLYGILVTGDMDKVNEARQTPLHQEEVGAGHRIGAIKIFSDGTFGSCTAYMEEPYTDQPDKRGFLTTSSEEIYRRMVLAHQAGLQVAVHAIGDAANRTCVELFDRLLREYPGKDHRHRLEHASQLSRELISEIARLGLVVSTQPSYIDSEKHWLHQRLGRDRTRWTYPFRSLVEAGVKVAGASDSPIESVDVLSAIHCCVTREGFEPQQCITAAQAIRAYTLDAAYAQFEDAVKGSISPGKRADLVVLSANPASVLPQEIRGIEVEMTVSGGKVIYSKNG